MVDDINSQNAEDVTGEPKPKSGASAFLSTPTGRLVVGGTALFIVVVAIGALAFFFLLNQAPQVPSTTPTGKTSSQTTTLSAPPVNPPEAPLKDSFTFRNVFAPSVHPATVAELEGSTETSPTANETSTAGGGSGSTASEALVLESIATDSGERVATFTWKGTTYEVNEGDTIGTSPWKVLEIYSDSVLLLYGDSRVTLSVGQGYAASTETVSK